MEYSENRHTLGIDIAAETLVVNNGTVATSSECSLMFSIYVFLISAQRLIYFILESIAKK